MRQRNGRPEISAYALAHILQRHYYTEVDHEYTSDDRDIIYEVLVHSVTGRVQAELRNRAYGVEWLDVASGRVKQVQDGWCEEMILTA